MESANERTRPVFVDVPTARGLLLREYARALDARAPREVAAGRLPGAASWPARDVHPVSDGVRRPATSHDLRVTAERLGIHRMPVVIYGGKGGADAAHLWWTLTAYGHPAAFLLDGGFDAWARSGAPLETGAPDEPGGGTFAPRETPEGLSTIQDVLTALEDPDTAVLDTRSADEYTGELAAAARGGHVPGAHHVDWERTVTPEGALRPRAELADMYASSLPADRIIAYCQSGVRAAHTAAVLRHLGHPNASVYLGSWGEWGNRPDLPVARPSSEEAAS